MTTRFQSRNEWLDYCVGRRSTAPEGFRSTAFSGLSASLDSGEWVEVSRDEWMALPDSGYERTNRRGSNGRDRLLVRRVSAPGR